MPRIHLKKSLRKKSKIRSRKQKLSRKTTTGRRKKILNIKRSRKMRSKKSKRRSRKNKDGCGDGCNSY